VAPKAISKAAQTSAGKAVARKAADLAFEARMLKPTTTRQAIKRSRGVFQELQIAQEDVYRLQDEIEFMKQRDKLPDYDYMDLYEAYNPVARETKETIRMVEESGGKLSRGRKNRMLMEGAQNAYGGIPEFAEEELRFAKRNFRERGRALGNILRVKTSYIKSLPPAERAKFIERDAAQRAAKLRRQLDLSNARRNMPENYVDPEEFFK
jgi:hypothetical protein